jgi:uncharacterized membrane protein YeaQ/YmgE (transglycosylase-associated protein family)
MTLISLLLIGGGCGWLAHRFMDRCYGPLDDMLWGVLGALLGTSLVDLLGLSEYGATVTWIMTVGGAGIVLLLTNFKLEA